MSDEREALQATPAPAGALCALHPSTPAGAICARCGNYMCAYCSDDGKATACVACRERAGSDAFPFDRNSFRVFGLLDYAWQVFRHHWLKLSLLSGLAMILNQGIPFAINMSAQPLGVAEGLGGVIAVQALGFVVQTAIGVGLNLGIYDWSLRAIDGRPLVVEDLLRVLHRWPQALLATLIIFSPAIVIGGIGAGLLGVAMALGHHPLSAAGIAELFGSQEGALTAFSVVMLVVVLLIPVAIYFTLGISFMIVSLVRDPSLSAWGAIRESWTVVSGRRWRLLGGVLMIALILVIGLMMCLVGVIPAAAYASVAMTCMYNALRRGERQA